MSMKMKSSESRWKVRGDNKQNFEQLEEFKTKTDKNFEKNEEFQTNTEKNFKKMEEFRASVEKSFEKMFAVLNNLGNSKKSNKLEFA